MAAAPQPRNRKECTNRRDFIKYLREDTEKAKIIVFYSGAKSQHPEHRAILGPLDYFMSQYQNANFLYLDVGNVKSVANQLGITEDNVPTVILYKYGGDAPVWISRTDSAQLEPKVRDFLGNRG